MLAAWNSFVLTEHARRPVPGMSVLYERVLAQHPGAPTVYLSTGAWNVAPTLQRFLTRNMYPSGTLLLTDWGPTHDRFFRSGQLHKQENLRRLASDFRTCSGCWSVTTGSTTRASTASSLASTRRTSPVSRSASCPRARRSSRWPLARAGAHARRFRSVGVRPDGAGMWSELDRVGLVDADPSAPL